MTNRQPSGPRIAARRRWAVVTVYAGALLIGTVAHLTDLFTHGLRPHAGFAPPWLDLYWTSLAVLDPLALSLVVRGAVRGRSAAGVWLVCAVMATDIAANAYAVYGPLHSRVQEQPGLQRLLLFGLFVAVTARWLAQDSRRGTRRDSQRANPPHAGRA